MPEFSDRKSWAGGAAKRGTSPRPRQWSAAGYRLKKPG
ncbi:hypothetical protein AVDCRST_MAG84-6178 [uncultured Microcoleus sp.]|uniref:Uncharacterized protein n=1 Tax=uncultured Microcoleus sp. TaxID=259945 RepID=A0A6J4NZK9_9CYAN|nr:hypothetical protein AVDCRST_MAG84-6178 [uncultured Microcoleus sp.]